MILLKLSCVLWLLSAIGRECIAIGVGDLRLSGYMSSRLAGRLEVHKGGDVWGTFCTAGFSIPAAHVACRQMGFGPAMAVYGILRAETVTTTRFAYPDANVTTAYTSVTCTGKEKHLYNCQLVAGDTCSNHAVEVYCSGNLPQSLPGDVRLVGGDYPSQGNIQMFYNAEWHKPCFQSFDMLSADAVCRQLGYLEASTSPVSVSSHDAMKPLSGKWNCSGSETCSVFCFDPTPSEPCPLDSSIAISCTHSPVGSAPTINTASCTFPQSLPATGTVRLTGGSSAREGLMEIYVPEGWTTVCGRDGAFSDVTAHVVCKQLGYPSASSVHRQGARVTFSSSGVEDGMVKNLLVKQLMCNGGEASVTDCDVLSFEDNSGCTEGQDELGITCSDFSGPMYGSVYLDLSSGAAGEVQLHTGSGYGAICDDGFTETDADVVCQQMGYSRARSIARKSYYLNQSPKVLTNASCSDDREVASLLACPHTFDGAEFCSHSVGVRCVVDESQPFGGLRLVGGNQTSGILEYGFNGEWYEICPLQLSNIAPAIACRQLGYESGWKTEGRMDQPSRNMFAVFKCIGFETYFDDCDMIPVPAALLVHCPSAVHITCSTERLAEANALRLVPLDSKAPPTTAARYGQLEIYQYGRWGRFCADQFSNVAGQIACKELGFAGLDRLEQWNRPGSAKEFNVLSTICSGSEAALGDCYTDLQNSATCVAGSVYLHCERKPVIPTTETILLRSPTKPTYGHTPSSSPTSSSSSIGLIVGVVMGGLFVAAMLVVVVFVVVLLLRYYKRQKQEKIEKDWVPGGGTNDNIDFNNPRYEEPVRDSIIKSPPDDTQGHPPPDYSLA